MTKAPEKQESSEETKLRETADKIIRLAEEKSRDKKERPSKLMMRGQPRETKESREVPVFREAYCRIHTLECGDESAEVLLEIYGFKDSLLSRDVRRAINSANLDLIIDQLPKSSDRITIIQIAQGMRDRLVRANLPLSDGTPAHPSRLLPWEGIEDESEATEKIRRALLEVVMRALCDPRKRK